MHKGINILALFLKTMPRNLLLFILIGLTYSIKSQNLPLTFESNEHNFSVFGGTEFTKAKDPLRPNNNVAVFTNTAGSLYEGAFIDLKQGVILDSSKKLFFSLYHAEGDSFTFQIKLENSTTGEPNVYVQKRFKTSTWHLDSFNFAQAKTVGSDAPINAKGTYTRLTIFFEPNEYKAGEYHLDDIKGFVSSGGSQQNTGIPHFGKLVWADEFEYTGKPKSENWHPQIIPPNNGGWFNGEIQHYTDKLDNSYVSNGSMKIVLKKEKYTYENSTKDYTSARLNSKFAFTYGRIDVRAKLPSGNGVWPAIWTLGTNIGETGNHWGRNAETVGWPKCGEMDIMESWGHNPRYVSAAVHTQARFGGVETGGKYLPDPYNNYHVYSLVWTPEKLLFFVDSIEIHSYEPTTKTSDNWPFTKDQYILLNIAVLPQVDATFDSSRMEIDYVRVYQKGPDSTLSANSFSTNVCIYPNPASEIIQINSTVNFDSYSILDPFGRKIENNKPLSHSSLEITDLNPGAYLLVLHSMTENTNTYIRFIKE